MKFFNRNRKRQDSPVRTELKVNLHQLQNPPEKIIEALPELCERFCPRAWQPRGRLVLFVIERNLPIELIASGRKFLTYKVTDNGNARLLFNTHWKNRDIFSVSLVPDASKPPPGYKLLSREHRLLTLRHGRRGAPWLLDPNPSWELLAHPATAREFRKFVRKFVRDMMALPKRGNAAHHQYLISDDDSWLR